MKVHTCSSPPRTSALQCLSRDDPALLRMLCLWPEPAAGPLLAPGDEDALVCTLPHSHAPRINHPQLANLPDLARQRTGSPFFFFYTSPSSYKKNNSFRSWCVSYLALSKLASFNNKAVFFTAYSCTVYLLLMDWFLMFLSSLMDAEQNL